MYNSSVHILKFPKKLALTFSEANSITQMDVLKNMTWVHLVKGPLEHVIYVMKLVLLV